MCVIEYYMCEQCHLGYPAHTLYCPNHHPPLIHCPKGTLYNFRVIIPQACWLHPAHMKLEYQGFEWVDTYTQYGNQYIGQRPCARFIPTVDLERYARCQALQQSPANMQPAVPFAEPSPPPQPSINLQAVPEEPQYATRSPGSSILSGDSTVLSIAGPRSVISRQASPLARSTDNYPVTTSSQRSVASDAGASDTAVEFASQHQHVDEALWNYHGVASTSTSNLNPSLPPFYPKKKPGTSNSWCGSAPDDVIKGKEIAPIPSSMSDIGSRVHSRSSTPSTVRKIQDYKGKGKETVEPALDRPASAPIGELAPEPTTPITPIEEGTPSNMLLSPALSATSSPQIETRSPSARSPSPAETEKPASQPSTPVALTARDLQVTPGSEQSANPANRSWATIAGPTRRKALLPPLSTLQPHEALTPTPAPKNPQSKKTSSGKTIGQGSVTIGRSWTTSMEPTKPNTPPPDTIKKEPELVDTPDSFPSLPGPSSLPKPVTSKPKRSYSAALATAGEPAKTKATPTPRSASDDWPAPPPSWGRGRSSK